MSDDVEVEYDSSQHKPEDYAPWYEQFMKLPEGKRALIAKLAIERVEEAKPETAEFISDFKCILVGLCPRIEYSLVDQRDGETDVSWIHSFSMPTLLYWCPRGKFSFFVNANLDYNDTVLNRVKGNKKQSLRGFTA